jgi:hypothetical protein
LARQGDSRTLTFWLPCGNFRCPTATAPFFDATAGVLMIFEVARLSQAKSSFFFTGQRPQGLWPRSEQVIILFVTSWLRLFPRQRFGRRTNHALRARLCGASASRWPHSPPSSIGGVVPTGPAIMAPSPAASNTGDGSLGLPLDAADDDDPALALFLRLGCDSHQPSSPAGSCRSRSPLWTGDLCLSGDIQ